MLGFYSAFLSKIFPDLSDYFLKFSNFHFFNGISDSGHCIYILFIAFFCSASIYYLSLVSDPQSAGQRSPMILSVSTTSRVTECIKWLSHLKRVVSSETATFSKWPQGQSAGYLRSNSQQPQQTTETNDKPLVQCSSPF